jgi:Protein of unknown function (DUF541)
MTKKIAVAVLALALLPASTFAQGAPPRIVIGPNGVGSLGGITVAGRGTVRRKADGLRFTASLPLQQNGTRDLSAADQLVAALRANGIADAQVQPPGPYVGPNNGIVVTGTVRNPSDARLRDLVTKVSAQTPGVAIQNLQYTPFLDDCSGDEQRAIDAAFADAQHRAVLAAAAAHVTLGDVVAMNVYSSGLGCVAKPDGILPTGGPGPRDGGNPTDVVIDANANVTFAIAGPAGGARRRPL